MFLVSLCCFQLKFPHFFATRFQVNLISTPFSSFVQKFLILLPYCIVTCPFISIGNRQSYSIVRLGVDLSRKTIVQTLGFVNKHQLHSMHHVQRRSECVHRDAISLILKAFHAMLPKSGATKVSIPYQRVFCLATFPKVDSNIQAWDKFAHPLWYKPISLPVFYPFITAKQRTPYATFTWPFISMGKSQSRNSVRVWDSLLHDFLFAMKGSTILLKF